MLKAEEYAQRVYAGVLGKCIGVYLGRPLEGWTYDRIRKRYGTVEGYVSRAPERPLGPLPTPAAIRLSHPIG